MKKVHYFSLLFLLGVLAVNAQERQRVFGKVSDGKGPLQNVNVKVVGKEISSITDAQGKYEIWVEAGEKLQYSYTGLKTITIRIEDVTRILNPIMVPQLTELSEVTVRSKKKRNSQKVLEEEYETRRSIVQTAFGYIDTERSGGTVRLLNEEQVSPSALCILDVLRLRFAGIRVVGSCTQPSVSTSDNNTSTSGLGGAVFVRGSELNINPIPAIFDVDGQIFTDVPFWINSSNIKRIAVFVSLSTTVRYGSLGAGGVVTINTISGNFARSKAVVDQARLRNNYVTEDALSPSEIAKNNPDYLKKMNASGTFAEAKSVFEQYENQYYSSPYFYLDAYKIFYDRWNERDYADRIIADNFSLLSDNAVLLKALAYTYQEQERHVKANGTFKDIFILRPNYAQSYLDIANNYRNLREYQRSALIHMRYQYLIEEGFMAEDTVGLGPIMARELNNLLTLRKNDVVGVEKVKKVYVEDDDFKGTRLVFEWNDGEAEFELQFVNPENQYYTWKHSRSENEETIVREKEYGYNIKEYLIDGSLPGTWKVNVNYLGNKSLTPTYLKATVYHNYGTKEQRKEVKVFKLNVKNVNQELFSIKKSPLSIASK